MTEGTKKVWAYSLIVWIGTAAVVTFNTAAAVTQSENLAYAGLALTGMMAIVGIGFGIWAGYTLAKEKGKLSRAPHPSA